MKPADVSFWIEGFHEQSFLFWNGMTGQSHHNLPNPGLILGEQMLPALRHGKV